LSQGVPKRGDFLLRLGNEKMTRPSPERQKREVGTPRKSPKVKQKGPREKLEKEVFLLGDRRDCQENQKGSLVLPRINTSKTLDSTRDA